MFNILSSTWYQGNRLGQCQSAVADAGLGAGRDACIMSWVRDFSSPMEHQFRRRQGVKRHLESQFCGYARGVVVTEGVSAGEGVIVGQLNGARLD